MAHSCNPTPSTKLQRLFEAQMRSAEGDHTLLLEICPGPSDDTSFHADSPRRCALCGVYEPIVALVRQGDGEAYTAHGGEAEAAICADSWECVRRKLHGVGAAWAAAEKAACKSKEGPSRGVHE